MCSLKILFLTQQYVRGLLGKSKFLLDPRNQTVTALTQDGTNWAPTRGPHSLGLAAAVTFWWKLGKKHHFQGQQCSLSPSLLSLQHSQIPEGHGVSWLHMSGGLRVDHFGQLIIRVSREVPIPGCLLSRDVLASVRSVYTAVQTDRPLIWGKQRQIWICPKAGSTDHDGWDFRFQGWVGL